MEEFETLTTDVLVIGAGGAGMRAAIEAAAQGAKVMVICKSLLGKAHTVMAEGGVAAALANVDGADSWQVHFQDTMRGGQMINNWRMAEIHAKESPDRVYELETWGAHFRPNPGRPDHPACIWRSHLPPALPRRRPHRPGDHPHPAGPGRRAWHRGPHGVDAYQAPQRRATGSSAPSATTASMGVSSRSRARRSSSRRVAGGALFKVTSNSWEGTGDGVGMGYEAGAEILDPEMVQFHPTGMVWPPGVRGILVTEAVRGEGGYLTNREGKRFMLEYDPKKKELSSRDVVARSIYKEVQAGRGTRARWRQPGRPAPGRRAASRKSCPRCTNSFFDWPR